MQDLKLLADFMTELWNLIKADPDIDQACRQAVEIDQKYSHDLAKMMLYAYLDYREATSEKRNRETTV